MSNDEELAWWLDEPIELETDDALGRAPFAQRIAQIITGVTKTSGSTVIGLVGPWGSGKTSTVNMIRTSLPDELRVSDINPWALAGPSEIVHELLTAILSTIPKNAQDRE